MNIFYLFRKFIESIKSIPTRLNAWISGKSRTWIRWIITTRDHRTFHWQRTNFFIETGERTRDHFSRAIAPSNSHVQIRETNADIGEYVCFIASEKEQRAHNARLPWERICVARTHLIDNSWLRALQGRSVLQLQLLHPREIAIALLCPLSPSLPL